MGATAGRSVKFIMAAAVTTTNLIGVY